MGLGISKRKSMGLFDPGNEARVSKKLKKEFLDAEVFDLAGRRIKRSRGLR